MRSEQCILFSVLNFSFTSGTSTLCGVVFILVAVEVVKVVLVVLVVVLVVVVVEVLVLVVDVVIGEVASVWKIILDFSAGKH